MKYLVSGSWYKYQIQNTTHQLRRGFTLVETLVAISIITIAIVGPLLTASRTLVAAYTARDQLTASYLASEASEYVRFMRDSMYLADYQATPADATLTADAFCDFSDADTADNCAIPPANSGYALGACVGAGDGTTKCTLADPLAAAGVGSGKALAACGAACPPLYLNNGRYTTTSAGTATTFVRTLQLYSIGSELSVLVTVSWQERGTTYSTSLTDYLSPWQ